EVGSIAAKRTTDRRVWSRQAGAPPTRTSARFSLISVPTGVKSLQYSSVLAVLVSRAHGRGRLRLSRRPLSLRAPCRRAGLGPRGRPSRARHAGADRPSRCPAGPGG